MSKWKYLVGRCVGNQKQRQNLATRLAQLVRQNQLSETFPMVKYELRDPREYYLGLVFNSTYEENSWEARRIFRECGISGADNPQVCFIVESDEAQGFLQGTPSCNSFTIPIPYEGAQKEEPPASVQSILSCDPDRDFLLDVPDVNQAESERFNQMLCWCSAAGSGSFERFKSVCQTLGFSEDWGGAWSVLRRLVLLGNLEFVKDGGGRLRWGMPPPTLVTSADGGQQFLSGQRTHMLSRLLIEKELGTELPQPGGPTRLLLPKQKDSICYKPGCQITAAGCVSQLLAERLPALAAWESTLPVWDENQFSRFETQQYDIQNDRFIPIAPISGNETGLFRFTVNQVTTIAYRHDRNSRWRSGDYYGLRFLMRSTNGGCAKALYRKKDRQLIIPLSDRWPMPYERALVLADGMLPYQSKTGTDKVLLVYGGLTSGLVEKLSSLLNLSVEYSK